MKHSAAVLDFQQIDELRHAIRRSRRVLKQKQCAMSVIWDPEAP
jgi:hypothetical protein